MRIVVLGGYGNFGARICRALAKNTGVEVIAAGRDPDRGHREALFDGRVGKAPLDWFASWLDRFGTECGGMLVSLTGTKLDGATGRVAWHLTADNNHGPEIPCMPAILLVQKLMRGEITQRGAAPCMGFLTLDDFAPEFARWNMQTCVKETS